MLRKLVRDAGVFTAPPSVAASSVPRPRLLDAPLTQELALIQRLHTQLQAVFGERSVMSCLAEFALAVHHFRERTHRTAHTLTSPRALFVRSDLRGVTEQSI